MTMVQYTTIPSVKAHLNPFKSSGFFYLNYLGRIISKRRGVWSIIIINVLTEIPVFNANIVEPDQTPYSSASDLLLHCLSMSLLGSLGINGLS